MSHPLQAKDIATVFLRLAIGVTFLSAVADRFGWWGPFGAPNVSWGDFHHFVLYTQKLTSMMPASSVPSLAWISTIAEILLGAALIVGWQTRIAALLSSLLLLLFALSMTYGLGLHPPLSYSVFIDCASAFLLATCERYQLSLDEWLAGSNPTSQ